MRTGFNLITIWFGAIMIVFVLTLAFIFALTDYFDERLYGTKRIFFVILLLAYAVYRGFRLRQALKNPTNQRR